MRHVAAGWLCLTLDCVHLEQVSTCDGVHSDDEVNAYICQGLFAGEAVLDQPVHGDAVTFHVAEVGGFNN